MGNTLKGKGSGYEFLSKTSFNHNLKSAISKLNLIKLKSFCVAKQTINPVISKPTESERIFASYTSDRGSIYQEFKKGKNQENK